MKKLTRIRLHKAWLVLSYTSPLRCYHGPQVWPWWRLFSLSWVRLEVHCPSTGYRLWVYSRWGSPSFDFYVDRRERLAAL